MKKITLLFAFLVTSLGFAQTELITNGDFSNDKTGWGGSDFVVQNGEAYFATTNAAGNPWDTQLTQASMTFTQGNQYVLTFKARAAAARKMTVAIQNVNVWNDQFRMEYDLTTTMTEFTATFNAPESFANVQIGFLMAATGSTDAVYFDDVSIVETASAPSCSDGIMNGDETGVDCGGSCNACPEIPAPTTAPTAPTAAANTVTSIFSDEYTDVDVNIWGVTWSADAAGIEDKEIASNNVKLVNVIAGKNYAGVEFINDRIDASGHTHFHMDYWIDANVPAGQVMNIKFSNHANTDPGETGAIQNAAAIVPTGGSWQSIDLVLDDLVSATADPNNKARNAIAQLVITPSRADNQVPLYLYLDNIYFYGGTTASVENNELLGFSMYPNPASNRLNISAKETIQSANIFDVLGKNVMSVSINKTSESIDISSLNSGIYLVKYDVNGTTGTAKFIKE